MKKILDYLFNSKRPHWSIILEGKFVYGGNLTRKQARHYAYVYMDDDVELVYKHGGQNGK